MKGNCGSIFCFLGNCIVIRKTTYDNGYSWKSYIPEVDFESENWEDEYQTVIDNRLEWGEKTKEYFDLFWTREAMVDYFLEKFLRLFDIKEVFFSK